MFSLLLSVRPTNRGGYAVIYCKNARLCSRHSGGLLNALVIVSVDLRIDSSSNSAACCVLQRLASASKKAGFLLETPGEIYLYSPTLEGLEEVPSIK